MYQPITVYIGLRYYIRELSSDYFSRIISLFPIFAIALGMSAIIVISSIMNGFEKKIKDNVLKYIPHVIITNSKKQINPKDISLSMLKSLDKNIKYITPIITSNVIVQSNYNISLGIMIGVNSNDMRLLFDNITTNYLFDNNLIDHQYNVIIGSKLADDLKVRCGDKIRLIVPEVILNTLIGDIPSQRLFNIVGIFYTNNEDNYYQIIVHQKDASRLMHYIDGYITGWRIWLNEPLNINQLFDKPLPGNLIMHDWREIKGEFFQAVFIEKNIIIFLLSLIIIAAIFNIVTLLNLSILEKIRDIAILKIHGLFNLKITLIFLIRSMISVIVGILLGIIIGIILTSQINNIIMFILHFLKENILTIEVIINSKQIALISLISLILTLLTAIYSSWYATKINCIKVLKDE